MKKTLIISVLVLMMYSCFAQEKLPPEATEVWNPEPKVVKVDESKTPSDAIVLFDGTSMNSWYATDSSESKWIAKDGSLMPTKDAGYIMTKESFGDIQLHLEFKTPDEIDGEGQGRGNSGVFLQSRYEVQILDSYKNRTYFNGQCASIYKQHIPLVNSSGAPGVWQVYDIIYKAPDFNSDGIKTSSGYITVLHNGVLVQNHVEIKGTTLWQGLPENIAHGNAPILLQDHGNPVEFRNIWVRTLE